jgi:ATP-dependent Clp protease ATP-binding subunit ClpA
MVVVDSKGKYEALEKYGIDLTEMEKQGKLDPVIGRDEEIQRCKSYTHWQAWCRQNRKC